uniref:Uncharacterized protein n=1 Tax=OCS116 cluster bacterium TaxID=2030921 RepID=A0A2A4Z198_9PROT
MQSKHYRINPKFVAKIIEEIELCNQDNFLFGSSEYNGLLQEKLNIEIRKSEKIGEYLDLLEIQIAKTQKIANSLLIKKNTGNTELPFGTIL